jgi:mannose-6-phosphate isomerase
VLPLYPLTFQPRFKERIWGGRRLETLYGKNLPPDVPIGESWEISDRAGDESVIANGALAGRTLRHLMDERGADVLGAAAPAADRRFPLLCKLLDARQMLSLQVHPPARAADLGDPKTEMWYIADAEPGAELFVGLKRGVTREGFEKALAAGQVAECFHRIAVKRGDAMFLPSGRVHGIGAGLVIYEIQQNSDTTFRVYDWDRPGRDGKPRELHIPQSLESIDFGDFEPALITPSSHRMNGFTVSSLVDDELFSIDVVHAETAGQWEPRPISALVAACVEGFITVHGGGVTGHLQPGDFCLLPAAVPGAVLDARPGTRFLAARPRG